MNVTSNQNPARRGPHNPPGFRAIALSAVVVVSGVAVVVRGLGFGYGAWRGPHVVLFVTGILLSALGIYLFQRGLRRRARARAIAELLPHYRERMRFRLMADAAAAHARRNVPANDWWGDDSEWADEVTDAPPARAEMRAATRALLVSLEDEIRQQTTVRHERSAHPACRRVRLRAAGRMSGERRRRTVARSPRVVS